MSGSLDDTDTILRFRERVLLRSLKLEIDTGLKLTRGRSAYAMVKQEYSLKGNKQRVYDQFNKLLNKRVPDPR